MSDDSVGNKGSVQTGSNGSLTNSEGSELNKILVQIFEMSSGIKVDKDSSGGSNSNSGGNSEGAGSTVKTEMILLMTAARPETGKITADLITVEIQAMEQMLHRLEKKKLLLLRFILIKPHKLAKTLRSLLIADFITD